tara:strand:- start:445 stop:1038 length:594 start_codon:yes stop_codon:yes gene_type:complete
MIIGIDVDDVLADFMNSFVNYHNDRYNTDHSREDFKSYNLWETLGGSEEEAVRKIYDFYHTSHFDRILPTKGSKEAVDLLRKNNSLRVITSRPYDIHDQTLSWLDRYFSSKFEEAHFTNEWAGGIGKPTRKKDVCLEYNVDFLIEDSIAYAKECTTDKTKVLLMDKPWNRSENINDKIIRVYSWENVTDLLKQFYPK